MRLLLKIFSCSLAFGLIFRSAFALDSDVQPTKEWLNFLDNLKKEMLSKGISEKTIKKAYGDNTYYHPAPEVVLQDKKQAEFILTSKDYLNRLVSESRVKNVRKHYKKLQKKYMGIEEQYTVPLNYLVAFWAVETNFGENKGKYHLIDGLTNLSYKNRRAKFFKQELYNVLKIMEKYDLESQKMYGSWAGAMGHFQFMPSTYNAYAVDYDGDGIIDIWDSFDDALASAANYLTSLGWKKDEPWGGIISLPWNFNYKLTGYKTSKTVSEWRKLGLKAENGKSLSFSDDLKGSVITPDGRKGKAYLVFSNFRRIMIWNRSENYALAVSMLADYAVSDMCFTPVSNAQFYTVTNEDILKIQCFINKYLHTKLKEDGKLGPKTKDAIRTLQSKAGLHQDGYPDYVLLNKIKNYNPKNGFAVPVQPRKKVKNTK